MSNEAQRLIAALSTSDQLKSYLSNLRQLKEDGAVTDEQYGTVSEDYERRLAATTHEIEMLRGALEKQLDVVHGDIGSLTSEREAVDIRFKAGEITLAKSRNEDRRLGAQVDKLERNRKRLAALIAADSAAGLSAPRIAAAHATSQRTEASAGLSSTKSSIAPTPTSRLSTRGILNSKPRVAAVVVALLLLISVRMPWLAPSELLGSNSAAEAGVTVSFLAGLGGLVCGLTAAAVAFVRSGRTRGTLHIILGVLAFLALAAAIALGEIPLYDSYFRQLIVMREGLFVYVLATLVLIVMGAIQRREA